MANSFWDKEVEIISVEKNKKENIIVKEVEKGDNAFIEIRVFYKEDDVFKPSPKGVAIPKEKTKEIVDAILAHLK